MKTKIRLLLGQPLDAPFANFIPALALLAVLFFAGSVLLWTDAFDTLGLSRERAQAKEIVVAAAALAGEESYSPRVEITAEDGEVYSLLKSQLGNRMEAVADALESGDAVTLRLSRKGRVLEVQEGDLIHLDFDQSVKSAVKDVVISSLVAVTFDLFGLILLLRCIVLKMNRKNKFRFGPAR